MVSLCGVSTCYGGGVWITGVYAGGGAAAALTTNVYHRTITPRYTAALSVTLTFNRRPAREQTLFVPSSIIKLSFALPVPSSPLVDNIRTILLNHAEKVELMAVPRCLGAGPAGPV